MRKPLAFLTLLGVITFFGASCYSTNTNNSNNSNNANTNNSNSNTNTNNTNTNTNSNSNAPVSTSSVSISNFAFVPPNITVKKGTKVTWKNNDTTTHTITGNNGGPSSGNVLPGASYSYTFNTVGTFPYHCSIHTFMTGSVTVTQ